MIDSPYMTIAEAAAFARLSTKRIRNLMATGQLREGVHYTRPRGTRPRFKRLALVDWLEGADPSDQSEAVTKRKAHSRLDLSLLDRVVGARGEDDGLQDR
jgi:hypothetical protein